MFPQTPSTRFSGKHFNKSQIHQVYMYFRREKITDSFCIKHRDLSYRHIEKYDYCKNMFS